MNQFTRAFQPEKLAEAWQIVQRDFPEALWETVYVTILSTLFAIIIGLPLGMLLVAGDAKGIRPMPSILMKVINVAINLLRSIPFLILIVVVIPLTRLIVGTSGVHRSAGGGGFPLCGPSGGIQPARGEPQHHRDRPVHGCNPDADPAAGDAA